LYNPAVQNINVKDFQDVESSFSKEITKVFIQIYLLNILEGAESKTRVKND